VKEVRVAAGRCASAQACFRCVCPNLRLDCQAVRPPFWSVWWSGRLRAAFFCLQTKRSLWQALKRSSAYAVVAA